MHDPRQQLYKTKITLLAVILTVVGLAIVLGAAWAATLPDWHWLEQWPLRDIGLALFTTGLVAVAFAYVDGKDGEERNAERLGAAVEAKAPVIVQAVLDSLTASTDNLALLTADKQDALIRNGLTARLGDAEFAREVYDDIRDQAVRAAERWHDVKIDIRLDPLTMVSPTPSRSRTAASSTVFYSVTVRWEYRVVPHYRTRRFACTADLEEYRELEEDLGATSAWYMKPKPGIDPGSREAFELVQFSIDGDDRPIRRSARKDGQTYTVDLGHDTANDDQMVTVSYLYRTITARDGHMLYFDIEQPTNGVEIHLDYSACPEIAYMNVLDFIASSQRSRIARTPEGVPGSSVEVAFDGWIFPRSGVAFVWTTTGFQSKVADPRIQRARL